MTTPHISAPDGSFAPDVLMPGDPLRARHIAQTYFDDPQLITSVRAIEGYTGTWNGKPVSVMASGMGIPSMCIYATELFRFYDVQRIIRVGTCGSLQPAIGLNEVLIASSASTDSNVTTSYTGGLEAASNASPDLVRSASAASDSLGLKSHLGSIFSSDLFYHPDETINDRLTSLGFLGIEMEAAGLYHVASHERREALTIATVSDLLQGSGSLTPEERETGVGKMVELALQTLA
ncbi:MAG: purine-nucleoside phosphorylase [Acidimicrobiales bacterium]